MKAIVQTGPGGRGSARGNGAAAGLAVLALALGGCHGGPAGGERQAGSSDSLVEQAMVLAAGEPLGQQVGQCVTIEGRLARAPWQHLVRPQAGYPLVFYLDRGPTDQIVLYAREPLPEGVALRVRGRVIEVRGGSKRPGSGETGVEYQLVVERFEAPGAVAADKPPPPLE